MLDIVASLQSFCDFGPRTSGFFPVVLSRPLHSLRLRGLRDVGHCRDCPHGEFEHWLTGRRQKDSSVSPSLSPYLFWTDERDFSLFLSLHDEKDALDASSLSLIPWRGTRRWERRWERRTCRKRPRRPPLGAVGTLLRDLRRLPMRSTPRARRARLSCSRACAWCSRCRSLEARERGVGGGKAEQEACCKAE